MLLIILLLLYLISECLLISLSAICLFYILIFLCYSLTLLKTYFFFVDLLPSFGSQSLTIFLLWIDYILSIILIFSSNTFFFCNLSYYPLFDLTELVIFLPFLNLLFLLTISLILSKYFWYYCCLSYCW
jgi:hypothetical protein